MTGELCNDGSRNARARDGAPAHLKEKRVERTEEALLVARRLRAKQREFERNKTSAAGKRFSRGRWLFKQRDFPKLFRFY